MGEEHGEKRAWPAHKHNAKVVTSNAPKKLRICDLLQLKFENVHAHAFLQKESNERLHSNILRLLIVLCDKEVCRG